MRRSEALIIFVVNGLVLAGLFLPLSWLGNAVDVIGVFVVPGWLMTRLMFDEKTKLAPELRFILTFALGAFLVFLESFILTIVGIKFELLSLVLVGVSVSWFLYLVIEIKNKTFLKLKAAAIAPVDAVFLFALLAIPFLIAFSVFHKSILREDFTEFYFDPPPQGTDGSDLLAPEIDNPLGLTIVNHSSRDETFLIICKDPTVQQRLLETITVNRRSSVHLTMPYDLSSESRLGGKTIFELFRASDQTPYRQLDFFGIPCNSFIVE